MEAIQVPDEPADETADKNQADEQFNTTDVCVIVKTDLVTDKYFKHYSRTAAGDGNAPSKVN